MVYHPYSTSAASYGPNETPKRLSFPHAYTSSPSRHLNSTPPSTSLSLTYEKAIPLQRQEEILSMISQTARR